MIRKITGIVFIIIGIALYFTGNYVANEVKAGRKKIENAQQAVDAGTALTKTNKATKGVGDIFASPIQKRIDDGRHDAAYYESVAYWLHLWAVIITILGIILFIFGFVKKKN